MAPIGKFILLIYNLFFFSEGRSNALKCIFFLIECLYSIQIFLGCFETFFLEGISPPSPPPINATNDDVMSNN